MHPEDKAVAAALAAPGTAAVSTPLRWTWVGTGVVVGAALITTFVWAVDPLLARPALSTLIASLTLILVGMMIAYKSEGETIRETGLAGLALVVLVTGFLTGVLGRPVPLFFFLLACLYGPTLALGGGWVGEMLQGTLADTAEDARTLEWPWIAVGVIVGFMLNVYSVFMADALFGLGALGILACFGGSFMVTGYIVGLKSPGITIIEPALAAVGMVILDAAVAMLAFEAMFPMGAIVIGMAVGVVLALVGGWLGEIAQVAKRARRKAAHIPPA